VIKVEENHHLAGL